MMKLKYIVLGCALMILCNSCQKDVITSETSEVTVGPLDKIETSVSGLVTDQEGSALADVSVEYRGEFITTDENGYFKFKNVPAYYDGGLLKFEQDGFFKNYKWFYPQVGDNAFVRAVMVTEKLVGKVSNEDGGIVTLNGGATINFPASAFQSSDDELDIYAYWYNPTGDKLAEEMPGDLRAIDSEEALVQLATYGMVAVEIKDADGNDIQLAEDKLATIEFPLPDELAQNASEIIKTWSFDEDRAYWKEEGEATLVGDKYVAEVSHFSFWNCDAPFPVIHITGRLVNKDGVQLPGIKICITDLDRANTRMGWTSYNGAFSGKVPKDTPLKLVAKDDCTGIIYQGEIGPFSEDQDLGDITADNSSSIEVIGSLVCDGVAVTNGYALIALTTGALFVAELDADGTFTINLPFCELNKISVKGYNSENNKGSEWQVFENFESEVFVGDIEVCDGEPVLDEYIRYKMNGGVTFELGTPEAKLINGQLRLLDSDAQTNSVTLHINDPIVGDVTVQSLSATMVFAGLSGACGNTTPTEPACLEVTSNLSLYEPILGEYIMGTFMGTVLSADGGTIDIMGEFRVKLDEIISESTICGIVWEDTTNDGIRGDNDPMQSPPSFSRVSLLQNGQLVNAISTTAGSGEYSFTVQEGNYQLRFTKPAGYIFVEQGAGGDDTLDSDVDPTTGLTKEFAVDGTSKYSYDVGLFWDGMLSCDDFDLSIVNASCGNNNGSYRLNINSQDTIEFIGYTLETVQNGDPISSIDFLPWVSVEGLEAGPYTYILYDDQDAVVCTNDFVIEESDLDCAVWANVYCDGPSYIGEIELDCNTGGNYTIEWETGETGNTIFFGNPGIYSLTITDDNGCTGEELADFSNLPVSVIQGTVWLDSITGNPSQFDQFEQTLQGITVNLIDSFGNTEQSTITNNNGYYSFTDFALGETYQIGLELPDIYELVPVEDPNNPDFISDSDIDPDSQLSEPFQLQECGDFYEVMIGLKQP